MDKTNSVLIVDDSKENIDALRSILDELYTIYVARSGEAALKTIERVNPDLILLDVIMPGMGGFEVLDHMKSNKSIGYIPVIFITGETDAFSEERGLILGAVDYIAKPYNPNIVSVKVKNQLENKMYRDKLERLVDKRTKELVESRQAIIMGMSFLAEGRDQGTGLHLQRMQTYTRIIAERMSEKYPSLLSPSQAKDIVLLAPLHDIGKVNVSDAILLKHGPLTNEEFEEMKRHTVFGADVLRKTQALFKDGTGIMTEAIHIAESHHEKYDGTGYPHALKGEEIPISARIVTMADIYDALTSKREYKDEFSHDRAMQIMTVGDGRTKPSHFDPVVMEIFKEVAPSFTNVG